MNTVEERIRAAAKAAADTVPAGRVPPLQLPPAPGRRYVTDRQRQRVRWLAPAAAAVGVVAVFVGALAVAGQTAGPASRTHGTRVAKFPGGGRILLSGDAGSQWLYADGKTTTALAGFTGASLADGSRGLLAWRPTQNARAQPSCGGCSANVGYYVLALGGTSRRLVLPADLTAKRGNQVVHEDVQLAPGGAALGYIRLEVSTNGSPLSAQLWTRNLATGASADLGPVPSYAAFVWQNQSTIVAQSHDLRSLVSINATTGAHSQLISVSSPRIVHAFQQARPGAGMPTLITPLGVSQAAGHPMLAVDLTAAARNGSVVNDVVAFLSGGSVTAYAPGGPRAHQSLTLGPNGYFAILTTTSPSGCPPLNGAAYVGNVRTRHLARVPVTGKTMIVGGGPAAAAFSPGGRYLAVDYQGLMTFTRTPAIASLTAGSGYPAHFVATAFDFGKTLQGWAH